MRAIAVLLSAAPLLALDAPDAALFFDFQSPAAGAIRLHGARHTAMKHDPLQPPELRALEFRNMFESAEAAFSRALDGVQAASIGGWFYTRRKGEQVLLSRGLPEVGVSGDRFLRPEKDWVNFTLGTDSRGFFFGTINGNAEMPFVYVTVDEVPINTWNQLVVVKTAEGHHRFYRNGTLVHTDRDSTWGPKVHPFRDVADGEPVRLAVPQGGLIGEVWIYGRELSAEEIRSDYLAKRSRFRPAPEAAPVELRDMDEHHSSGLWKVRLDGKAWPVERGRIEREMRRIFGAPPAGPRVPANAEILSEEDAGTYIRRKVSLQVQPGDRMFAWLLVPKQLRGRVPAVICIYGTTSGAGKDTTVGLSGPKPGTPPRKNRAFAVDMAEAGFVAVAPDFLRDGERVTPGRRPYDTTEFYEKYPNWSIHGKDAWDTSRLIDWLETLPYVDASKIGMVGHSYGGHSTIFVAAHEPRIKVAVANGPVSDFYHHGMHWAVAPGEGRSQSLPALRPYLLERKPPPLTFYEVTSLIAPRPLLVGEAAGERRPIEEENAAAVNDVYDALGASDRVRYVWYAGDHDFPPAARRLAVDWFRRWFQAQERK
jgi:hypothetical protein